MTRNIDLAIFRELSEIDEEITTVGDREKALKDRRKALEEKILDIYAEHPELDGIKVAGRTIYLHERTVAKLPEGRPAAVEALKVAGLDGMVSENFNTQTLAAYIAECKREGKPLPAAFEGRILADAVQTIRTRKAS